MASSASTRKSTGQKSPQSVAGQKRKRPVEQKYYAVREGRRPGVYQTWAECLEQIKGHKNALCSYTSQIPSSLPAWLYIRLDLLPFTNPLLPFTVQAFPSSSQAEAFISGRSTEAEGADSQTNNKAAKPSKYYAVRVGRRPGVYTDWPTAQAQIKGWKGPKHRRFDTRAEAEEYVAAEFRKHTGIMDTTENDSGPKHGPKSQIPGGEGLLMSDQTDPPLDQPGLWPLPTDAIDGFDPNVKLGDDGSLRYKTVEEKQRTKLIPVSGKKSKNVLKIYTDGSALNNGQGGAVGGVGVYFGPGHKRYVLNSSSNVSDIFFFSSSKLNVIAMQAIVHIIMHCTELRSSHPSCGRSLY